jgi:hypothetical protein
MDKQARTGDTVLVKSKEMTGRIQTLPWWLGGEGVKTTENKMHLLVGEHLVWKLEGKRPKSLMMSVVYCATLY